MSDSTGKELLREEFNRWAEAGRGEEMEESHLPIVEPTLAFMNLQPSIGCWMSAAEAGGWSGGSPPACRMVR